MKKKSYIPKKNRYKGRKKIKPLSFGETVLLLLIVVGILFLITFFQSKGSYDVVIFDETHHRTLVASTSDFNQAQQLMQQEIKRGSYNPAIISEGKIIDIRYGIIVFNQDSCNATTPFTYENGTGGYTNACYGADALYAGYDDGWKMQISGAIGKIEQEHATLYDINDPDIVSYNHYEVINKRLYHIGTGDVTSANSFRIDLGKAPNELKDGIYYSYDSHYFYDTYEKLADDIRTSSHKQSINQTPFYNYFQYLPHRSLTRYDETALNQFISNELGFTSKPSSCSMSDTQSLLYGEGNSFINVQRQYGVNGTMLLSLAMHESAYGRSEIACTKFNLFGHAAYDDSPQASANTYDTIADSINAHAINYIVNAYANPKDNRYHGSHFGDKASGMNVRYASDPYWGEKSAAYVRRIDEASGNLDENHYILRIIPAHSKFYGTLDAKEPLFEAPNDMPVILYQIKKHKGYTYLQVQSDAVIEETTHVLSSSITPYHFQSQRIYVRLEESS